MILVKGFRLQPMGRSGGLLVEIDCDCGCSSTRNVETGEVKIDHFIQLGNDQAVKHMACEQCERTFDIESRFTSARVIETTQLHYESMMVHGGAKGTLAIMTEVPFYGEGKALYRVYDTAEDDKSPHTANAVAAILHGLLDSGSPAILVRVISPKLTVDLSD